MPVPRQQLAGQVFVIGERVDVGVRLALPLAWEGLILYEVEVLTGDGLADYELRMTWPDGTERHAVVEEVEPERKLSFRWLPFQRTAWGDVEPIPSTRVEITLDEVSEGTRVRVVEQSALDRRTTRIQSRASGGAFGPVLAAIDA